MEGETTKAVMPPAFLMRKCPLCSSALVPTNSNRSTWKCIACEYAFSGPLVVKEAFTDEPTEVQSDRQVLQVAVGELITVLELTCEFKGSRPGRDDLHMLTAELWASRSVCRRLKVGAIITTADRRRILSIGYNGPAKGLSHDRCQENQEGNCGCLHAEDNAIARVDSTIPDKILFVSHAPCEQCAQRIVQAGISSVFFRTHYRQGQGVQVLKSCHIQVAKL